MSHIHFMANVNGITKYDEYGYPMGTLHAKNKGV